MFKSENENSEDIFVEKFKCGTCYTDFDNVFDYVRHHEIHHDRKVEDILAEKKAVGILNNADIEEYYNELDKRGIRR